MRGKSGRATGNLVALLTLMKSQPLAYNKDNQEDKEALFDTVSTVKDCLRAFADMVPAIEPNEEAMRQAALEGFSTATDLADYLVRAGIPSGMLTKSSAKQWRIVSPQIAISAICR